MTPTTRNKHPGMQNNATRIGMAIVMRIIGNSGEKSWWQSHPSIMATERSKGVPRALLCAQYSMATKARIFDYVSHYHAYEGYAT